MTTFLSMLVFLQRIVCLCTLAWSLTTDSNWLLSGFVSLGCGIAIRVTRHRESPAAAFPLKPRCNWVLHGVDTILAVMLVPVLLADPTLFLLLFGMIVCGHFVLPLRK